jgi:putative Ca2+/H+ antiporter (TMEM165/GDT1 family)
MPQRAAPLHYPPTEPLLADMDLKPLLAVFATIFLAELGDKTQLATLLYSASAKHNPWLLFLTCSAALVCAAGIAVLAGGWLSRHLDTRVLAIVAGIGFMAIGAWTVIAAVRG